MTGEVARQWSRVVPLAGAGNFRDFGGYPVADEGVVRRGFLYRSNRLSQLNSDDIPRLNTLGIRTIFDLRARREREGDPTVWTGDHLATYTFPPGHKRRLVDMALDYPPTPEGATRLMHDFYSELPRTMGHMVADIVHRIAADRVPCVVHCSAGKDRTGIVAALILGLLGVDRDTILDDYVLTASLNATEEDMARSVVQSDVKREFQDRYSVDTIAVMRAARPEFLGASFAAIDRQYGSFDAYFSAIGVAEETRHTVRQLLVEK